MAYINTAIGSWTFLNTLADDVASQDFTLDVAGGTSTYQSYSWWNAATASLEAAAGLVFSESNSYTATVTTPIRAFDNTDLFSLGFYWYSPAALGYTRHAVTRETQARIAPIVAYANATSSSDAQTITSGSMIIQEIAASATQNKMQILFYDTASSTAKLAIETDAYDPGLHAFSFVWDAFNWGIACYVDGSRSVGMALEAFGSSNTSASFRLNSVAATDDSGSTYLSHIHKQAGGYISNLVVIHQFANGLKRSIRYIRYGVPYVAVSGLANAERDFYDFGISFNQPSTITTNQVYSSSGNIYAARSSGELLKGERPIWDRMHNYESDAHVADLTVVTPADGSTATKIDEGLRLTGSTVRI